MGRRIPSTNNRTKLKSVDPFYKGDRRYLDRGLNKANRKPNKPSAQEVPRKMLELFEVSKLINDGKMVQKKKRRKKEFSQFYENPIDVVDGMPIFKRLPGEDDKKLLKRIGLLSKEVVEEFHMRETHDNRSEEKILDDAENKDENFEDDRMDAKVQVLNGEKKLTSTAKKIKRKSYQAKKKEKKRLKVENRKGDFDHLKDEIKFGEVSIRPPLLTSKPRKAQNSTSVNKPGKKNLLLKKLLDQKEVTAMKREINPTVTDVTSNDTGVTSTVDRTVKRKLLTVADRRKLDKERDAAVLAYRALRNRERIRNKAERKLKAEAQSVRNSLIKL